MYAEAVRRFSVSTMMTIYEELSAGLHLLQCTRVLPVMCLSVCE